MEDNCYFKFWLGTEKLKYSERNQPDVLSLLSHQDINSCIQIFAKELQAHSKNILATDTLSGCLAKLMVT